MKIGDKKDIIIFGMLIGVLLLTGCTRDITDLFVQKDFGKQVMVTLQVNIPKSTTPIPKSDSRAIESGGKMANNGFRVEFEDVAQSTPSRSDGTTNLYNLWLFQFNADGTINGVPHKVSDAATAINDMVLLDVPLNVSKNQTLYLLALGRNIEGDFSLVNSFDDLEKVSFEYTEVVGGGVIRSKVTTEDDMPFAGHIKGVSVVSVETGENRGQIEYNTPDGFAGGIGIKRLMSKVTLRYKFDVSDYKLDGMRLINANTVIRITNPAKNDETDTYATLDGIVSTTPDANGFYEVTWFMAQNHQGDVASILTEGDRHYKLEEDGTYTGKAPKNGTNVEAWAYSTTNPDSYAIYQMYLGKNSSTNFDVTANTHYNLRTEINTDIESAKNDGRIRSYLAKQSVYLNASDYTVSVGGEDPKTPKGSLYDLDAHCDMRPVVINTRGRIVSIGIYEDQLCKTPVNPATSWLKFSSKKNYTAAVSDILDPLKTEVETDLIQLPTQLRFYLYSDEFTLDDSGEIPIYSAKRTLYIQIQTVTDGVSGGAIKRNSVVYRLDQRPAVYLGRAGGKMENGQYTQGLCGEQLTENTAYSEEEKKMSSKSPIFGYYQQNIYNNINYDGVNDPNHGRLATIQMVYNKDGIPLNIGSGGTTLNLENPIMRPDGYPLLYQYHRFNTFAARYCYDKNRDNNGNGYLDDNEIIWYMPAIYQLNSVFLWYSSSTGSNNFGGIQISSIVTTGSNGASTFNMSTGDVKTIAQYGSISLRCVRDMKPAKLTNERLYEYTDDRGNTYGAIDAKDIPNSENRADNPDFYVDVQLHTYTEDGIGSVPVIVDGNPVYVKRMKRHAFSSPINKNISSHFAISHVNIDEYGANIGVTTPTYDKCMFWANSMGYLATANTSPPITEASAVARGCPMYRGKDGNDEEGSWRVPTHREWVMIAIYLNSYNAICDKIASKPIPIPDDNNACNSSQLWTATEYDQDKSFRFGAFNPRQSTECIATTNKKTTSTSTFNQKRSVRCIKDLPPTK